jgi:hypothetical protein
MNGADERIAQAIRQALDAGTAELRPGVAYRLQQARAAALARLAGEAETAGGTFAGTPALAGLGSVRLGGGQRQGRPLYAQLRVWIALLVVVAAVFGWQQWTAWQELQVLEDLDAQILTSDLPIDAYLDRGFQLWLKSPPPSE